MKPAILLLVSCGALLAQFGQPLPRFPGQSPRTPGNNGPGIPSRGRTTDSKPVQQNLSGIIRNMEGRSFDLEASDTRIVAIHMTDTTTKPAAELKVGDGVDVVVTQDKDGQFQAVSIKSNPEIARTIEEKDRLPEEQPEERTGPPPTILVRPDQRYDDGDAPPRLKRGIPERVAAQRKSDEAEPARPEVAPLPPSRVEPVNPRMAFVEKARAVAGSFLEGLPNYVCQEVTTRYASETRVPSWNVIDVIGAEVVYESGQESYRNLTLNGKPMKKAPEESGAWSTGEFGTILAEVFSPGTSAAFKYAQEDSISRRSASVYDFTVDRRRSSWKVRIAGQYIYPAYKGSVWLDKETAHALRIEMQAREIPSEFPLVSVETAVDYDYVTLGTPEKFLLPVRAEVLSCSRGSNECERNVIEFRNYHKFTGESTIKFNEPQN